MAAAGKGCGRWGGTRQPGHPPTGRRPA